MSKPIAQSDDARTKLEKQAPFNIELKEREKKAIVGSLHVAKRTIDNMHPFEREAHNFSQKDIREIEQSVREKLSNADWDQKWTEVTFTVDEIIAMQQGTLDVMFSDGREMTNNMKRLHNLLLHHTNPHN